MADPVVHTYDPAKVTVSCGGKIIHGYMDSSAIEVERDEQTFNKKVGVDGEGARAKNNNRGGKITLHLMQHSSSNDDLMAFALADELNNAGVFPVIAKDGSGRSVFSAVTAWVQKPAKADLAKEITERVWIIDTNDLDVLVAGN